MIDNVPVDFEQELIKLIAEITGRNSEDVKPDANFWKDLGVDSIKAIEITVAIERKYKIRVKDEDIPKIATINQAAELIKDTLAKKT